MALDASTKINSAANLAPPGQDLDTAQVNAWAQVKEQVDLRQDLIFVAPLSPVQE